MPIIPYVIQNSVQRLVNGRKRWFVKYKTILVDVSDEVAAFLAQDNEYEKNYQSRMKKLMRRVKAHKTFSLDEVIISDDGLETSVGELIADTVHQENFDPLELVIEKESRYERKHNITYKTEEEIKYEEYIKRCASKMTKKQFEVWVYHEAKYSNVKIAKILGIDESSVRERIKNALKRIE